MENPAVVRQWSKARVTFLHLLSMWHKWQVWMQSIPHLLSRQVALTASQRYVASSAKEVGFDRYTACPRKAKTVNQRDLFEYFESIAWRYPFQAGTSQCRLNILWRTTRVFWGFLNWDNDAPDVWCRGLSGFNIVLALLAAGYSQITQI